MNQRTGSLFSLQTRYPLSAPDLAHVVVPHRIADHLIFIPRDIGFRILENQGYIRLALLRLRASSRRAYSADEIRRSSVLAWARAPASQGRALASAFIVATSYHHEIAGTISSAQASRT